MSYLKTQEVPENFTVASALANRARSIRHLKAELCNTYVDVVTLYGENDNVALQTLDDTLGIDSDGANDQDRDYLEYLIENPTVGLDTMAGRLRVDKQEILKRVEPFLLEKGWVQITSRGRKLTTAGYDKVAGSNP